jgi:anti-sigma factor RsiW
MNEDAHKQAREQMADAMLGILSEAERRQLDEHLHACADCANAATTMREAVGALRAAPVQADPALVNATRRSVRLYAERLQESESRMRMMLVSSAVAAVVGAVSLPFLFRLFAWMGAFFGIPQAALYVAVMAFWLVPGLLGALAVYRRSQSALHAAHSGPDRRTV